MRVHGFIPPYLQQKVIEQAAPARKPAAQATLEADMKIRDHRKDQTFVKPAERAAPDEVTQQANCIMQRQISYNQPPGDAGIPGDRARFEGDPPADNPVIDTIYDNLSVVNDFLCRAWNRNGIRGRDYPYMVTAGYHDQHMPTYNNAAWDGKRVIIGEGDGVVFRREGFATSLDILAHEIGHGVVSHTLSLRYEHQAGALNESLADVIAILVVQYYHQYTVDQSDWLIGKALFTDAVHAQAVRSLREPGTAFNDPTYGKDPQVSHMDAFQRATFEYDDDVHINSGIPSRAFYLVAAKLGGYAWETAGRVWYHVMSNKSQYDMRRNSSFATFASATVAAAGDLYGPNSPETDAVRAAWQQVGVSE